MKDISFVLNKFLVDTLGTTFTTTSGVTVRYSADPQPESADNYAWSNIINAFDDGTKDTFITEVTFEIICVSKENQYGSSSITLDLISNKVMELLVQRGYQQELENPLTSVNVAKLHSITLDGMDKGQTQIGEVTELFKRLQFKAIIEQL